MAFTKKGLSEKADKAMDKKAGVKENGPADKKMDRAAGVKSPGAFGGKSNKSGYGGKKGK